jgi:NADPH-dependent 2,4-dienoyl-CoA reductase/sulfur reductase-like enzyme
VAGLIGDSRVEGVELASGERVPADIAVVGLGAVPNTEWLADSELTVDPGLQCDATLTALGDPDILGAGDIVSWPHPLAEDEAVRIEHWTVAAEQGQLAGRNALLAPGERKPYVAPPYFWSDQYDVKIQSLGLPGRADAVDLLESTPDGARRVYGGARNGRLVGIIAINAARRLGTYRMALEDPPVFEELRSTVAADPGALCAPVGTA